MLTIVRHMWKLSPNRSGFSNRLRFVLVLHALLSQTSSIIELYDRMIFANAITQSKYIWYEMLDNNKDTRMCTVFKG